MVINSCDGKKKFTCSTISWLTEVHQTLNENRRGAVLASPEMCLKHPAFRKWLTTKETAGNITRVHCVAKIRRDKIEITSQNGMSLWQMWLPIVLPTKCTRRCSEISALYFEPPTHLCRDKIRSHFNGWERDYYRLSSIWGWSVAPSGSAGLASCSSRGGYRGEQAEIKLDVEKSSCALSVRIKRKLFIFSVYQYSTTCHLHLQYLILNRFILCPLCIFVSEGTLSCRFVGGGIGNRMDME